MNNFAVPNIIAAENATAPTYRQNEYRISVLDLYRFQIPIILPAYITGSINRPAD